MQSKPKVVWSAAALVGTVMAVPTFAATTITWKSNTANADWGAVNWTIETPPDAPADGTPLFDGTEDAVFDSQFRSAGTELVTVLNGDRTLNSLSFVSGLNSARYAVRPGSGGKLTIESGNLSINAADAAFTNFAATFGGSNSANNTTIVVTGGTSAAPASWVTNTTTTQNFGAIEGSAARVISLTGKTSSVWWGDSSNFLGEFRVKISHPGATGGIKLILNRSNSLGGAGSLLVADAVDNGAGVTNLHFIDTEADASGAAIANSVIATSHLMNIRADSPLSIAVGTFGAGDTSANGNSFRATLNGNLSGSQDLIVGYMGSIGSSGFTRGTLIVNGANNTLSGRVAVYTGAKLQIDGTWIGAGDVQIPNGMLLGNGSLGLASGKKLYIGRNFTPSFSSSSVNTASLAPGTNGTIGTFTVGTADNGNAVNFTTNAITSGAPSHDMKLLVDIDGAQSDSLVINGDLVIGAARTFIDFNVLSAPTLAQYTIASWTGTLTGTFANEVDLPSGYSLQYGSNQLLLVNPSVPEPASMAGLLLLGCGLLARRRAHSKQTA